MTEEVDRATALAYRAAAQGLKQPATTSTDLGVLDVGVQDTPPGATARLALRARPAAPQEDPTAHANLCLVHSLRGAMHVHRATDLGLLSAALRPDQQDRAEALDQVAVAMAGVLDQAEECTKGELSSRVTPMLPSHLRTWCPSCRAEHVPDGLFREATLPAGLRLHPAGGRSATLRGAAVPDAPDVEVARRELLRRFLRRCGPATPADLAAWTGCTPSMAGQWWALLADDFVEIRVQGTRAWMHPQDLDAARAVSPSTAVRLLPAYDPLTEVTNRRILLPDPGHRRQVWRAVANPGAVLLAGEVVATWRRRKNVITVTPLAPLPTGQRRVIEQAATAQTAEVEVDVTFDDD